MSRQVTHDEAREILSRFNASHWRNGRPVARYSIPADLERDDDILLARYIEQNREREAAWGLLSDEDRESALEELARRVGP